MGDGVLRQYSQAIGVDQLRDAVVDLGINMVGTAGQHDAPAVVFPHPAQGFLPFFPDSLAAALHFFPSLFRGGADLRGRDLREGLDQLSLCRFQTGQGQERIPEIDLLRLQLINIVFDVFRVGGDDGTVVMVVGVRKLVPLIGNTGIEDQFHSLLDQPGHMPMGQLCRIAFGLAGDGFNAQLINLPVRGRGENNPVAQLRKEGVPEGVVFVHIQHPGNSDDPSFCLVCFQGSPAEEQFVFEIIEVWNVFLILFLADAPLAAVSADKLTAAGEAVDGQAALVGTALALGHGGGKLQAVDLIDGEHGGLHAVAVALPGDQSRAEGPHDAGDIRADGLAVRDFLKASKHRVVVEGASLDNDVPPKLRSVGNLDYLI